MNELMKVLEDIKGRKGGKPEDTAKQQKISGDFSRVQSPSSINTFIECPRKYYYKYIKGLPTKPSIHLIRGKLVHSVLEDFFKLDVNKLTRENFEFEIKVVLVEDFKNKWEATMDKISGLGLSDEELMSFRRNSRLMISNFVDLFSEEIKPLLDKHPLPKAFEMHAPEREIYLESKGFKIRGFIDAMYTGDKTRIIDYKTSSTDTMRDEYRRQLAIYALMYHDKYGKLPDEVGIHFLLYGLRMLKVTTDLLKLAKDAVTYVHSRTKTGNIFDYPKGIQPLCKWRSGQCDFYDVCGGR